MGGLCIAASEFYKSRHNIILSSGILFVSAGRTGRGKGNRRLGGEGKGLKRMNDPEMSTVKLSGGGEVIKDKTSKRNIKKARDYEREDQC